jgi:hypothetical protein
MTTPPVTPNKPPPVQAAVRKKRWRKALRRLAYAGLGLLGIALVIFFLLPVWISNEQGRTYVLQQINKNMRAKVDIEDWSLGWFRGTELQNVTVSLPDGSRLLSCPHVQSDLTLWGILWGRYDIGITRVDTAQLAVTRYADGSNSLGALLGDDPQKAAAILQTLRGSLQVGSAVVTINSVPTGKSITYTDVKAGVTIASPDAPFHVQISAVGGNDLNLALNATLPALATWNRRAGIGNPAAWEMISDVELTGTNLPTALVCDYIHADPRWEESIGPIVERLKFVNHVTPPLETSTPTLEIRGTDGAYVDAALLLRAASRGSAATLSLSSAPGNEDFHANAALRLSPPLVDLLRRINPLFGDARRGDGLLTARISDMNITSNNAENSQAIVRLTFPTMELDGRRFTAQLLQAPDDVRSPPTISAAADPLKLRIGAAAIAYDNFTVLCGRQQRITFTGSVGLDGKLDLLATVPSRVPSDDSLASSRTDLPITGTIDKPVVTLPQ